MIQYRVSNALRATFEVSGSLADLEAIIRQLWTDEPSRVVDPGVTYQWDDGREERDILVLEVPTLMVLPKGKVGEANTTKVNRGVARFRVHRLMEKLVVEAECVLVHGWRLADTLGVISHEYNGLWDTLQWKVDELFPSGDYERDLVRRFEDDLELRRVDPVPAYYDAPAKHEIKTGSEERKPKGSLSLEQEELLKEHWYNRGYTNEDLAKEIKLEGMGDYVRRYGRDKLKLPGRKSGRKPGR